MMSIEKLEQQIVELEQQHEVACKHIDDIRNETMNETILFMKGKFKADIECEVTTNTQHTKHLGVEKLKLLKRDMVDLIEQTNKLVDKHVNKDNIWSDLKSKITDNFDISYNLKREFKKRIEDSIRNLMGYTGKLLVEYEYVDISKSSRWQQSHGEKNPKLIYGFCLPDKLDDLLEECIETYDRLCKINNDLKKTRKQKEETEALMLWEQA